MNGACRRRAAAIDCGTNSIQLLIADLSVDNSSERVELRELARVTEVVRLGRDILRTPILAPDLADHARRTLIEFADIISAHDVQQTRMCLTWISRSGCELRPVVELATSLGLNPEMISGRLEAELAYVGATSDLPPGKRYLVADIGGGSMQLVTGTATPENSVSLELGCLRLTGEFLHGDPPTHEQQACARRFISHRLLSAFDRLPTFSKIELVGLSEAVFTVAAVSLGKQPGHHARLTQSQVASAAARILSMSLAERTQLPAVNPKILLVMPACALVVDELVNFVQAPLTYSRADILDGIARSLWPTSSDRSPPASPLEC